MAVGTSFNFKELPKRYKINPYFEYERKSGRKIIEKTIRHAVKIYLRKVC